MPLSPARPMFSGAFGTERLRSYPSARSSTGWRLRRPTRRPASRRSSRRACCGSPGAAASPRPTAADAADAEASPPPEPRYELLGSSATTRAAARREWRGRRRERGPRERPAPARRAAPRRPREAAPARRDGGARRRPRGPRRGPRPCPADGNGPLRRPPHRRAWRSTGGSAAGITEGRLWLDAALRMRPAEETAHRARALHGAGVLDSIQGDFDRAVERLDLAFRLRVRLGLNAATPRRP